MAGHLRRLATTPRGFVLSRPLQLSEAQEAQEVTRAQSGSLPPPPAGNTTYTGSEKDDLQAGGQTTTTTQTWLTSGASLVTWGLPLGNAKALERPDTFSCWLEAGNGPLGAGDASFSEATAVSTESRTMRSGCDISWGD